MQQALSAVQLHTILKTFSTVALFLGNGPRRGYASVPVAIDSIAPHMDAILAQDRTMLAVFGGDTAVEGRPDLGLVMKGVRERWGAKGLRLLAVQGWDEVDAHVDFVHRHEEELCGSYGGFDATTGCPLGATSVYMGQEFLRAAPGGLKVITVGTGGRVGSAEMARAADLGLSILRIPAPDASGVD